MNKSPLQRVRVRFAPSPTGSLHIGSLRTALFNWLFARHHGGDFILRIEDTDQKRFDPTALHTLMEALRWAGLQWDEGPEVGGPHAPYFQSERLEHYQQWAAWLVERDKGYKCFCTSERLQQVNKQKEAQKLPPGYDRHCRSLSREEVSQKEMEGLRSVIRFKMPLDGKTIVPDLIRGEVEFDNTTQQDMVLLKSDGFPTYHLAHIVDDHLMEISHVMRAVEWFPSLPLHVQIWQAFGWDMPIFAHLPVLLNPNGQGKISKRNPPKDKYGNIIPVMVHDYVSAGYLPEAVNNFLANIGWNFGDAREVFTMQEAIERFDGTRINPANSAFPVEKLDWLNGTYIRNLSPDDLAARLKPYFDEAGLNVDIGKLQKVALLIQERIRTLGEAVKMAGFIFRDRISVSHDDLISKKVLAAELAKALRASHDLLGALPDFSHEAQEAAMRGLAEQLGLKAGDFFGAVRVAVTGQKVSPPLFQTMEIIGRETSLARIEAAAQMLES